MSILEIILLVAFSIIILTTFLLYYINSRKIQQKAKQLEEQKAKEKREEEKAKMESEKAKKVDNIDANQPKQVVQVVTDEQTKPTVAVITETPIVVQEDEGQVKQASIEENESQLDKPLSEQIEDLSPELKAILLTDILKPKF